MATAVAALDRSTRGERVTGRTFRRRIPYENLLLFAMSLALYIVVADYLIYHLHYVIDDSYARVDNSFDVLFTSDPHLAAIGFFWPPLPSFLMLPILAFKGVWPDLLTKGFAGAIESAVFGAGCVVVINSGLRWAGVVRGMRWIICAIWAVDPMIMFYAGQGMSEVPFVFFFLASILVFLKWADSGRGVLLPLMGILIGLDCLCRNEAFGLAFVMGVAVVVMAVRRRGGWREVETTALLFALPAILVIGLWLGSAAVILHDPLYFFHANGVFQSLGPVAQAAPSTSNPAASAGPFAATVYTNLRDGLNYVFGHSFLLFPAVVPMVLLLAPRFLVKKNRLPVILLIAFGLAIPMVDILRLRTGLGPYLRYQIAVIPFTFLVAIYILRSLRTRAAVFSTWVALAITGLLGASTVFSAITLADPVVAQQEAPAIAALASGKTVPQATGITDAMDLGASLAPQVMALDRDHGVILADSTTTFPIILNTPHPEKTFIVTSDRNFQAALAQPRIYHVEYFLVPAPGGQGNEDALNQAYPGLWEDGAGFSSLVGQVDGGKWRLYRITGDTGRG